MNRLMNLMAGLTTAVIIWTLTGCEATQVRACSDLDMQPSGQSPAKIQTVVSTH